MERITSSKNPRIKSLVRLRSRRERDHSGRFLIEGYRELRRAMDGSVELETVYACPGLYLGENEPALIDRAERTGTRIIEVSEEPFRKLSYRDRPEGLVGVARQFETGLDLLDLPPTPLILVVEAIEKPGNLGTMLRTADAVGVSAVIVCDPSTDPFNPNVVRASLGTLFTVPLAVSTSRDTITFLHERAITTVATTPFTELVHWQVDLRGARAVVVGSEQYGLGDAWLRSADMRVRIPMAGSADSLNAAMAAGVVMYEAVRQRWNDDAAPDHEPSAEERDHGGMESR